jgi:hypothetical protein
MTGSPQFSTRARSWALFCQLTDQLKRVHGLVLRPTSYIRSEEEQFALYLRKLTDCDGHVKRSSHQDARALDCTLEKDGLLLPLTDPAYDIMGALWLSLDPKNVWGGSWLNPDGKTRDVVHCEYRPG